MPSNCFPVFRDEVEEVEKFLGIALPPRYKELLLHPKVYDVAISKECGYLKKEVSMMEFARLTKIVKRIDPDFPRNGVVMFAPIEHVEYKSMWGYLRFWVPDKKKPECLSETIYSWDLDKKKKTKDCSNEDWFSWPLEDYYGKQSDIFSELDINPPDDEEKIVVEVIELGAALFEQVESNVCESIAEWKKIGIYNLKGRYFTPCDYGCIPESQTTPSIRTSSGRYSAFIQTGFDQQHRRYISRFRLLDDLAEKDIKVRHEFSLDIDAGSVCVFDRQSFFKQVHVDLREELGMELFEIEASLYWAKVGKSSEVIVCPSGKGDGTYKVSSLLSEGRVVGMEIDFE